jgi:hypothetical protein
MYLKNTLEKTWNIMHMTNCRTAVKSKTKFFVSLFSNPRGLIVYSLKKTLQQITTAATIEEERTQPTIVLFSCNKTKIGSERASLCTPRLLSLLGTNIREESDDETSVVVLCAYKGHGACFRYKIIDWALNALNAFISPVFILLMIQIFKRYLMRRPSEFFSELLVEE